MLTRSDETVVDCLETWEAIRHVGVRHAGFKDVGVDSATLMELNRRMQASGVTTYLEVVSTSADACLRSAETAVEIGVDRLMGGTQVTDILRLLDGSGIQYLPFPGRPVGHPTRLGGDPALVEHQCEEFDRRGCGGVDLLAYRATDAEPLELVRAAVPRYFRLPRRCRERLDHCTDRRSSCSRCRRVHHRLRHLRRVLLAE